jgi:hypothetical protein
MLKKFNIKKYLLIFNLFLICLLSFFIRPNISKTYLYDKYYIESLENNYIWKCNIQTSIFKNIIIGKKRQPIYLWKDCILDKNGKIITNVFSCNKEKLIEVFCEDLNLLKNLYEKIKILNPKKIYIICGRRFQIHCYYKNKNIQIDFGYGLPDVKKFLELDEQYDLVSKYSSVDIRFNKLISFL